MRPTPSLVRDSLATPARKALLLAAMMAFGAVGCGKKPAAAPVDKGAASPANAAKKASKSGGKVVAAAPKAAAKIDPVPTGPAAGEKPQKVLPTVDPNAPIAAPGSLAEALQAKLTAFRAKAPKAKQATMQQAIDDLAASDALRKAVNIDAVAPDFTLPDATGQNVQLSALLKKGPVVLTWYRGGWCPYCNITLRHYAKMVPELQKSGATLVVVSPDTPDNSLSTKEKHKLPMVVLSDDGLKVARTYGLVYRLPPAVKSMYDKKFNLKKWTGHDKGDLPLAAAYVIGKDGRVRYAFLDADYRRRAEPAELLAAVRLRTGTAAPAAAVPAAAAPAAAAPAAAAPAAAPAAK